MANTLVKEETPRYSQPSLKKLENPHDKLFKETFSHLKVTKSFLHNYLPPEVKKYLNMETLKLEKGSFINKKLEEKYSDLLFSANIDGMESYVYFLFEHKSYPDKTVTFQLLKYMAEVWDLKMRKENLNQVPAIIPLLLYHGQTNWNIPDSLGGVISFYEDLPQDIQRFIPFTKRIKNKYSEGGEIAREFSRNSS